MRFSTRFALIVIYFYPTIIAGTMFRKYIQSTKEFLRKNLSGFEGEVVFCIGNEASDADSIISAVCFAFMKQKSTSNLRQLFIPVVSVPSDDLALRGDVSLLFKAVGMEARESLVCVDGISEKVLSAPFKKSLVLLDHNKIQDCFLPFFNVNSAEDAPVLEILDHHIDLGAHICTCNGDMRNIAFDNTTGNALVGSSCTLVYEKFQSQFASDILDAEELVDMNAISTLLMGVIALDTLDMDPSAGKGTTRDAAALAVLQQKSSCGRSQLFASLLNAKTDRGFWLGLPASDALRLDYKAFQTTSGDIKYGISSLSLPVLDFFDKKDSVRSIASIYLGVESPLNLMILMSLAPASLSSSHSPFPLSQGSSASGSDSDGMITTGGVAMRRELVVVSRSAALLGAAIDKISAALGPSREGKAFRITSDTLAQLSEAGLYTAAFTNVDVKVSRKVLAPMLLSIP